MGKHAKKRNILFLIPALIGVMYMIICIAQINRPISISESYNAYYTRYDFVQIADNLKEGVHPPFYYYLLKTWSHFFGHTEVSMRMLSVLCGASALLFVYLLTKRRFDYKKATIICSGLAVILPFLRCGATINIYTLLLLCVFASSYFLQLAIDNKRKLSWAAFCILTLVGIYTYYIYLLVPIAQALIFRKKLPKKQFFAGLAPVIILFIFWIPVLVPQLSTIISSERTCGVNAICIDEPRLSRKVAENAAMMDESGELSIIGSTLDLYYNLSFYFVANRAVYFEEKLQDDYYDRNDAYLYVTASDDGLYVHEPWLVKQYSTITPEQNDKTYAIVKMVKE